MPSTKNSAWFLLIENVTWQGYPLKLINEFLGRESHKGEGVDGTGSWGVERERKKKKRKKEKKEEKKLHFSSNFFSDPFGNNEIVHVSDNLKNQ